MVEYSFGGFSESPVVFGVWSISEMKGGRGTAPKFALDDVKTALKILQPDRVLIMSEKCKHLDCAFKQTRMDCKKHGSQKLLDIFGHGTYYEVYGMCDLQIDRVRQCLDLVTQYEREHSMRFDWVTRHRVDTYWSGKANPVTALNPSTMYMTPYVGRDCFGGFDWWYAMPRHIVGDVARFRDEITCGHLDQDHVVNDDPFYPKKTNCQHKLGCEGWLAAWMYGEGVPFAQLPDKPWPAKR